MKKTLIALFVSLILISCSNNKNNDSNSANSVSISGAGATFPLPFYNLAIKNYVKKHGVLVTYGGIGSGGGIRSLKDRVVDFGATDAFLSEEKEKAMPAEIIHIPTCIGAVVIAYNIPGIENLKLSNKNLEDIFMGKIKKWNDAELKTSNPGINLPDKNITVVHRSDGSGTTFIFSDYMSKISKEWKEKVGRGKSLKWPVGIGAKGNPGVAGTIKQNIGSIGYVGSEFAFAQKISFAKIQNSSGKFIDPNLSSISAAAKGSIPENTKVMLTNSSDTSAYPISGFTWLILYKEQNYNNRSKKQAEETVKFISWLVDKEAQTLAQQVHYAPLPDKAVLQAKKLLQNVVYNNTKILK